MSQFFEHQNALAASISAILFAYSLAGLKAWEILIKVALFDIKAAADRHVVWSTVSHTTPCEMCDATETASKQAMHFPRIVRIR